MQLSLLAQVTLQTVERYYLAIALLIRRERGDHAKGPGGALPAHGAAHDAAVRVQLAEFSTRAVRQFHQSAARARVLSVDAGATCSSTPCWCAWPRTPRRALRADPAFNLQVTHG